MTIPAKAGIKAPDNITYIYPHNKPVRGVIKVTRRGNLGHSYGRMRSGINKEGTKCYPGVLRVVLISLIWKKRAVFLLTRDKKKQDWKMYE